MSKSERNGKRMKRSAFQTRVHDLGYYFVFTDTKETEKNYLHGLRDSLPQELQGRIVIKVSQAKTDELVNKCKEQSSMQPQFRQPWIVFDRDKVESFDQIIAEANHEGINVGWSNPCIEIWFDTYFGEMHSYQNSVSCCRGFSDTFEKRTGQEYQKSSGQIYSLLNRFGDEKKAVEIAENRFRQHRNAGCKKPSQMCPCTTLHHLIDEIKRKVETNS